MNVVQSNMTNLLEINLQRFLIDLIYIQILSNTIFFCDKVPWVARSKANISMIFMEQKAQHYTKNTKKLRLTVSCDASSSKQVELKFLDLVNIQSKQQIIISKLQRHVPIQILSPSSHDHKTGQSKKNVCSVFSNSN